MYSALWSHVFLWNPNLKCSKCSYLEVIAIYHFPSCLLTLNKNDLNYIMSYLNKHEHWPLLLLGAASLLLSLIVACAIQEKPECLWWWGCWFGWELSCCADPLTIVLILRVGPISTLWPVSSGKAGASPEELLQVEEESWGIGHQQLSGDISVTVSCPRSGVTYTVNPKTSKL